MASNPNRPRRSTWPASSRLVRPRLCVLDVQALEPRFLLSGVAEVLTSGSTYLARVTPSDVGPAADVAGTRIDSYILAAGDGYPEVRVDLAWAAGKDPADGSIRVLDASGATLYDLPLDGVSTLHAILDIRSHGAVPASTSLDVHLAIHRDSLGVDDGGSYQLVISWRTKAPGRAAAGRYSAI